MLNTLIFVIFYFTIIFSVLGYGYLVLNFSKNKYTSSDLGYIGLVGILFLIIISYISHFFVSHNYIFNSLHNLNFRHCIWCIFLLDQGWREMAILCQQHSKPNRQGHQKKNRRTRPRSMTSSSISSTIFD